VWKSSESRRAAAIWHLISVGNHEQDVWIDSRP
jgi:hypothetical protein